ncbi:23377_t:CDS:1, partial [Entrophospora sp. SA101]
EGKLIQKHIKSHNNSLSYGDSSEIDKILGEQLNEIDADFIDQN